jgi:hypothetical protein
LKEEMVEEQSRIGELQKRLGDANIGTFHLGIGKWPAKGENCKSWAIS